SILSAPRVPLLEQPFGSARLPIGRLSLSGTPRCRLLAPGHERPSEPAPTRRKSVAEAHVPSADLAGGISGIEGSGKPGTRRTRPGRRPVSMLLRYDQAPPRAPRLQSMLKTI